MARISRKKQEIDTRFESQIYQIGAYLRLSVEESSIYESDSIQNQRRILREYEQKHPEIQLFNEYIDDGETGTNFNRPGFNQMIDDIREGKINGVIVKDLSRFGRNFEETQEYLLKIFPFLKVRFISVFDDYDSLYTGADPILIAIKNLFNDYYAKDVSQKVSKSLNRLRKEGKYWGPRPPYGYLINPENHHQLIIDPETANYVRAIFDMVENEESYHKIIKWLHKNEVAPPMRHFYELGLFQSDRYNELTKWYRSTIVNILRNPAYYGALPIAKSKRSLWENIPYHKISQEEWGYVENTHEAIVSQAQYQRVQNIMNQKRTEAKERQQKSDKDTKAPNLFPYKIYCGNCKESMERRYFRTRKGERAYYFICKDYSNTPGKKKCPNNYIRESVLIKNIMEILKKHISTICDMGAVLEKCRRSASSGIKQDDSSRLEEIKSKISEKDRSKKELYLDLKHEVLSEEEYIQMREIYAKELEELHKKKERIDKQKVISCEEPERLYPVICEAKNFSKTEEITDKIVKIFVKRIEVFPSGQLKIELHTGDAFSELLMLMKTLGGEEIYAK